MGETLHVFFGKCGSNIGTYYWENIINESSLKPVQCTNQLQSQKKYFENLESNEIFPRSIFVDFDSRGFQLPLQSSLFCSSDLISNNSQPAISWAKGFYTEGYELIEEVMEATRKKVEKCDFFKNFYIFMGLGGGTGSGMGSLFAQSAKEEYPKQFLASFSVIPSIKPTCNNINHRDLWFSYYNFGFANKVLNEFCDAIVYMDNEALIELCLKELGISDPLLSDLNYLIGLAASNITYCDRNKATECIDFTKLAVNLIPLPSMKYLTVGLSPILSKTYNRISGHSCSTIIKELLSLKNMFCFSNQYITKTLAATGIFVGNLCSRDVNELFDQILTKNKENYVDWIPNNTRSLIFNAQPNHVKISGTLISNSNAVLDPFNKFFKGFFSFCSRNAYKELYLHEGMDDLEFHEAYLALNDLIESYNQI